MTSERIEKIKLDINDLNSLLNYAERQKSKDILSLEIRKLQTELINIQNNISTNHQEPIKLKQTSSNLTQKSYTTLSSYSWDEKKDSIKLYITLNGVHELPKEDVFCEFKQRCMDLFILGYENKNYRLTINNLCGNINTTESHITVKRDKILVSLIKVESKTWNCLTSVEKSIKESKSMQPTNTDNDDPNAGLMNLMKKMYQDGDDEIKKTIAKAWTEIQEKKESGPGSMGDM